MFTTERARHEKNFLYIYFESIYTIQQQAHNTDQKPCEEYFFLLSKGFPVVKLKSYSFENEDRISFFLEIIPEANLYQNVPLEN